MEYCTFTLVIAFTLPSQSGSNKWYFPWARYISERGAGEKIYINSGLFLWRSLLAQKTLKIIPVLRLSINCTDSFG